MALCYTVEQHCCLKQHAVHEVNSTVRPSY